MPRCREAVGRELDLLMRIVAEERGQLTSEVINARLLQALSAAERRPSGHWAKRGEQPTAYAFVHALRNARERARVVADE